MLENGHWEVAEEIAEYLYRNLDRRVSVQEIAERCRFSPFYLNRLFRSVVGESIYEFEKRVRLARAASRLLKESAASVTEIAVDSGYAPSNFAVAFKERFGLSPAAWREKAATDGDARAAAIPDEYAEAVARIARLRSPEAAAEARALAARLKVVRLEPFVAYRSRYRGEFAGLGTAWDRFCPKAEQAVREDEARYGPFPGTRRYFGISLEDPVFAKADRFAYDLCVEVRDGYGRDFVRVPGGTYARYDWEGPATAIRKAFDELFGVAMPTRGLRMTADGPCLEVYVSHGDAGRFALSAFVPLEMDPA